MESIKKLEDQLMVKQKLGGEKVINEAVAASASSIIANGEVSCSCIVNIPSFSFKGI